MKYYSKCKCVTLRRSNIWDTEILITLVTGLQFITKAAVKPPLIM